MKPVAVAPQDVALLVDLTVAFRGLVGKVEQRGDFARLQLFTGQQMAAREKGVGDMGGH